MYNKLAFIVLLVHNTGVLMNLDLLKQALEPLSDYGKDELEIEVNNTKVVLKPLLPKEEIECQKYAASILADLQDSTEQELMSRHAALDYFDKFRIEVISYSLVQIGATNLRKVSTIETGDTLPNGVAKRVPRHLALRSIIEENWSRAMITICFSKYGDLITQLAEKAEKTVEMSISDLDAEIQRLGVLITNLEEDRDRRLAGDPSVTKQQIATLVDVGNNLNTHIEETIEQQQERAQARNAKSASEYADLLEKKLAETPIPVEEKTVAPQVAEAPKQVRQPVIPKTVPPPTAEPTQPMAVDTPQQPTTVESINGVQTYRMPSQTLSQRSVDPNENTTRANQDPRIASRNPNFRPTR